jgi:hypothetical protein
MRVGPKLMDKEMKKEQVRTCRCLWLQLLWFFDHFGQCSHCSESAEGEERDRWPHPHPGDLQEGAGGWCDKSHGGGHRRGIPSVE